MPSNSVTVTSTALTSEIIPIDLHRFRYGVGIVVTIPDQSSGNYDVQVTGDDLSLGAPTRWNKHDILQSISTSKNSNLAYPVTAVRLKANSVSGSIVMSVIQAEQ